MACDDRETGGAECFAWHHQLHGYGQSLNHGVKRLDRVQGQQAAWLVALTLLGAVVAVTLVRKGVITWSDLWNVGEAVTDG